MNELPWIFHTMVILFSRKQTIAKKGYEVSRIARDTKRV